MLRLLLLLGVAALLHWGFTHRRRRLAGLAADGLIDGTIVTVGTRHGVAFGDSTRWQKVVVRYVDETGAVQTVTQDAAGAGWWKPQVGDQVHLYRQAVSPGRVVRNRMNPDSELIVEREQHGERVLAASPFVIAAGAVAWMAVDVARAVRGD